jgi:hypothetical protein
MANQMARTNYNGFANHSKTQTNPFNKAFIELRIICQLVANYHGDFLRNPN